MVPAALAFTHTPRHTTPCRTLCPPEFSSVSLDRDADGSNGLDRNGLLAPSQTIAILPPLHVMPLLLPFPPAPRSLLLFLFPSPIPPTPCPPILYSYSPPLSPTPCRTPLPFRSTLSPPPRLPPNLTILMSFPSPSPSLLLFPPPSYFYSPFILPSLALLLLSPYPIPLVLPSSSSTCPSSSSSILPCPTTLILPASLLSVYPTPSSRSPLPPLRASSSSPGSCDLPTGRVTHS